MKHPAVRLSAFFFLLTIVASAQDVASFEKRTTVKKFSNGLTLSPDQSLLYVADTKTHWVYSYQIKADGSLGFKQKYYHLHVPDTADDSGGATA